MLTNLWKLSLVVCAAGHAYITRPIGRQFAASTIEGAHGAPEFCEQCWSGNGIGGFIANCGSGAVDGKYEDAPDKWVTRGTYAAGQVVDFGITFTAQHNGAHGFRIICADDRLGERLLPFTDAAWKDLKRNRDDPNHMTQFHREHFEENNWDTMAFIPQAVGNVATTVQFVVPADFPACNHAVIQWWWKTANSCTPSLFHGQRGQFVEDVNLGECPVSAPSDACIDGDCQMEQFNNCADVMITGTGATTSAVSTTTRDGTTTVADTTTTTTADDITTAVTTTGSTPTSTTSSTVAPTTRTGSGTQCTDIPLQVAWSGGGVHTCLTYEQRGLAYCDHAELEVACCFCGGGHDGTTTTTTPPQCTDVPLPVAWSGGGVHTCSTYEQHGGLAQCAHAELAEACCFCGASIRFSAQSAPTVSLQAPVQISRASIFTPDLIAIASVLVGATWRLHL